MFFLSCRWVNMSTLGLMLLCAILGSSVCTLKVKQPNFLMLTDLPALMFSPTYSMSAFQIMIIWALGWSGLRLLEVLWVDWLCLPGYLLLWLKILNRG